MGQGDDNTRAQEPRSGTVQIEPISDEVDLPFPLHEDEEVYAFLRRHWLAFFPKLFFHLIFMVVPPAILIAVANEFDFYDDIEPIILIASGLWIAFWLFRTFFLWYGYQHDVWVVTDQRLVDSRKRNPFNLEVSSADLVDVVDTSIQRRGIFQTALNYGDVRCQTAGSSTNFRLGDIPEPARVQALVDRLRDVARREAAGHG